MPPRCEPTDAMANGSWQITTRLQCIRITLFIGFTTARARQQTSRTRLRGLKSMQLRPLRHMAASCGTGIPKVNEPTLCSGQI